MTVNFNFFQKDKIMNVVLHVFYQNKKPECFLTSDFPTKKQPFLKIGN